MSASTPARRGRRFTDLPRFVARRTTETHKNLPLDIGSSPLAPSDHARWDAKAILPHPRTVQGTPRAKEQILINKINDALKKATGETLTFDEISQQKGVPVEVIRQYVTTEKPDDYTISGDKVTLKK